MNNQTALLFLFTVVFFVSDGFPSSAPEFQNTGSPFGESRIERAIMHRNSTFSALTSDTTQLLITGWSDETRSAVTHTLAARGDLTDMWHLLISGVLHYLQGTPDADTLFSRSLAAAQDDPGSTWLLFTEFNRYNLSSWVEQSLRQLEKQMFSNGAQSASVLSRQLLHYGILSKMANNPSEADYFFTWAHRFDPNEITSFMHIATLSVPLHPILMLQSLFRAAQVVTASWKAQLDFAYFAYRTIRTLFIIYLIVIGSVLGIKYLPKALHRYTHLFSIEVSPRLRMLLVSGITLAWISFGIIPFLWLLSLLIWKYVNRSERLLYTVVLATVLFSPFDSALCNRFRQAIATNGPIMQLAHSLYESNPSPTTSLPEDSKFSNGKKNELLKTRDIISTIKKGDWSVATARLNELSGNNSDPMAANLKGICEFFRGSYDSASVIFKRVLQSYPSDVSAQVNLARCHIAVNDATTGMEMLEKAANTHPELINRFIQNNDRYFSDKWPLLRQVVFPDYTPLQFWTRIFFPATADPSGWKTYWGISFLGISPLPSFILFIIGMAALILALKGSDKNRQLRRLFECKYCGRTLCRRCASGILCETCTSVTHQTSVPRALEQIREKIIRKASDLIALRNQLFNMVLPGSGSLLEVQPHYSHVVPVVALSVIVYTYWFAIVGNSNLPWMTATEKMILFVPPCIFHGVVIGKNLPTAVRRIAALGTLLFSGKG